MLLRFALIAATLLVTTTTLAADPPREQIGEVFGQPVYRDQLPTGADDQLESALHRLFLTPVAQRYRDEHHDEITPTDQELDAATAYFRREHERRIAPQKKELQTQLADVQARLASPDTPDDEKEDLRTRQSFIQIQLTPPDRSFSEFVLSSWKFEHHLYVTYGGGRTLWQQRGTEAYDATRTWLQDQEKKGAFKITDPHLRRVFYAYWTTKDHGASLSSDKEDIHSEFLEPPWAAALATRPASAPTTRPASAPASAPATQSATQPRARP